MDRSGARKAGQDDGESEEESQEDDSADDGDAYEGETFMVQSTMDMAHRDLGVRVRHTREGMMTLMSWACYCRHGVRYPANCVDMACGTRPIVISCSFSTRSSSNA